MVVFIDSNKRIKIVKYGTSISAEFGKGNHRMNISYSTNGLRSLQNLPLIELKPITVLVGKNNSGKSTFLRSLPLLKQSFESQTKTPISWYGNLVDFGDYTTAIQRRNGQPSKGISLTLNYSGIKLTNFLVLPIIGKSNISEFVELLLPNVKKNSNIKFTITVGESKKRKKSLTVFKELSMQIDSLNLEFKIIFAKNGNQIKNAKIGDIDLLEYFKCETLYFRNNSFIINNLIFKKSKKNIIDTLRLLDVLFNSLGHYFVDENIFKIIDKNIYRGKTLSKYFKYIGSKIRSKKFKPSIFVKNLTKGEKIIISNYFIVYIFYRILNCVNNQFENIFSELEYMAPVRAKNERYYRNEDLSVSEIDPSGENLPIFFNSLEETMFKQFSNWVKNHFEFGVELSDIEGHKIMGISTGELKSSYFNIADVGYGISQILPILAQIWWSKHKPIKRASRDSFVKVRTILMEQPELHLHPSHQAKIADALISVLKVDSSSEVSPIKFIVETHSDKLINRLGQLIFKNEISSEDVQVLTFSVDSKKPIESTVKICSFNKDGTLKNWPYGFFNSGAKI